VLCVDEKSQIQALDRTQPGLPLKRGRSQTMTHDYKRNGTATLFAALNAANGEVYGFCQERHRHQEWLRFLRLLDQAMPSHLDLHLIGDNYATHKHPKVQRWLQRHPRFHWGSAPNPPRVFRLMGLLRCAVKTGGAASGFRPAVVGSLARIRHRNGARPVGPDFRKRTASRRPIR